MAMRHDMDKISALSSKDEGQARVSFDSNWPVKLCKNGLKRQ